MFCSKFVLIQILSDLSIAEPASSATIHNIGYNYNGSQDSQAGEEAPNEAPGVTSRRWRGRRRGRRLELTNAH